MTDVLTNPPPWPVIIALTAVGVLLLIALTALIVNLPPKEQPMSDRAQRAFRTYPAARTPFNPAAITHRFARLRAKLGPEYASVRLHDLRHFVATELIGSGVDPRTVAERLGHADPSMTLRVYAHALPAKDRQAAEVMGRRLYG